MKSRLPALLVVVISAAALWWFSSLDSERREPTPAGRAAAEPAPERSEELLASPDSALESSGPAEVREEVATAPEPGSEASPDAYPRARVFGRLLDVDGLAVAGETVTLSSISGDWVAAEHGLGELPRSYEAESGPGGEFEFDVPLPTASWISLYVRSSLFYARTGRDFGKAGGRNEPPLLAGDNDVGDMVLVTTGAVTGRVFNTAGEPIEGASVSLQGSFPGGYSINAKTGPDGSYELGGAYAGVHAVRARANGYVLTSTPNIEIRDRVITPAIDFTLEPATSIAGRVVDEEGAPLAGVRLWGWPSSSGRGAGGRTADDGTFKVYLPQTEPYTLEATLEGYAKHDPGRDVLYEPGTRDIEIVLKRPKVTRFLVRSVALDAPVERFGLRVIRVRTEHGTTSSSTHRKPAEVADYPGGERELAAEPAFDDYTIIAPGYGAQRGRVEHDVEGERVQTVKLEPEAVITGRFVFQGEPLEAVSMRIERDRIPIDPTIDDEDDFLSDNWTYDLDAFAGRIRMFNGEADGSFRIDGLAAGTYELTLEGAGVAPLTTERLKIAAGELKDLGDVEAVAPATLSGVLVMPEGISPGGLVIMPGGAHFGDDDKSQVVDTTGRFQFTGLAAGEHRFYVDGTERTISGRPGFTFELGPGEHKDVVIDLTEHVPGRVNVLVELGGVPAPGILIRSITTNERGQQGLSNEGTTGPDGTCVIYHEAGPVRFVAVSTSGNALSAESPEIQLAPGGRQSVHLVGSEPGSLVLSVAESQMELSPSSMLRLTRTGTDPLERGIQQISRSQWQTENGRHRAHLGVLPPGRYEVYMTVGSQVYTGEAVITAAAETECAVVPKE